MAPLPTIANVVRIGLPWHATVLPIPYNVFHIATNSTDLTQIALDVGSAMNANQGLMFEPMSNSYTLTTVDVTPLDGHTATQNHPLGHTIQGGSDGQYVPAVCACVSFKTLQRGPRGRGRIYIGPIAENAVNNGIITGFGDVTAGWNAFNEDLADTDSAASLVVASYVHAQAGAVTAIGCDQPAATQRRRQRQLQR